ncbi:Heat shock protein 12B [Bonamia ostreae]|uniref:Heat shock protein 12B n=1 Tax=Bonamia ostreae TaxID=126728 RepID=A0ABV2AU02_9EUKA
MSDILGKEVLDDFQMNCFIEYMAMKVEFDEKMCRLTKGDNFSISLPNGLRSCFKNRNPRENITERFQSRGNGESSCRNNGLCRISAQKFLSFYFPILDQIAKHVHYVINQHSVLGTKTIIIVGEFSECCVIHQQIRELLPYCKVIKPRHADLAVVHGAAMYAKYI